MKPTIGDSAERQEKAEAEQDRATLKELKKCNPKTADYRPLNGFDYVSEREPSGKRLRRT
jgi:hypothetical protein